ncbi:MAG: response regulator transcription factor [Desulfitobacteriaceae bacterium]|nr:response regulator transcription factor [Desulfitobacteriaceae bacterium]MDI6915007.1 response regulator transcription factor [Desulfitobacteriaceae bacterium]
MKRFRLLIVDDHEVVVMGLKAMFRRNDHFEIAGEAYSGTEAIEKNHLLKPDIVIMDIRMPGLSGIEACREIKQSNPETNVIMLTSFADDDAVFASLMAGASGYVLKDIGTQALMEAVDAVGKGQSLLDPAVTSKVIDKMRQMSIKSTLDTDEQLTTREKKVLALITVGKTNREMAAELFLSEKTVRNYVSSILHKLKFQTRAQAIAYGLQTEID